MGEATEEVHRLYEKYGITAREPGPPKRKKKKQKSWISNILDRFKRKKKKFVPKLHPKDRETLNEIMEWNKKGKKP